MCVAENMGLIKPTRSHYSESLQTTVEILRCAPKKPPQLVGSALSHDLIVVSDLGGLVQRINKSGELLWQRKLSMPRGVDISNGQLIVGDGKSLRVIDIGTGSDIKVFDLDWPILMVRLFEGNIYLLMNFNGKQSVRRYTLSQGELVLNKSATVETNYARGLYVNKSGIYVADTFNHRIIILDLHSLNLLDQVGSYFPNSVEIFEGNRLLVAEEHLDAISEFKTKPLKFERVILGCQTNQRSVEFYIDKIQSGCIKYGSIDELYSPNDAIKMDDRIYISDTDNHRVIEIYDGRVVAQLTGFNSPINVRAIKH